MSILINNELIWIAIPKCASFSIEKAIMSTDELNPIHYLGLNNQIIENNLKEKIPFHYHFPLNELYEGFGKKETICINRNWIERWISSLEYIFKVMKYDNINPIIDWCDVDNNFIYDTFDKQFSNDLYALLDDNTIKCYLKLVKNFDVSDSKREKFFDVIPILRSEKFWKNNENCTYEFDINEIDKFESFISNRYNVNFKVPVMNQSSGVKSKIIIDDKLKNHLWEVFESPFIKRKELI